MDELPNDDLLTQAQLDRYRAFAEQSLSAMDAERFELVLRKIGRSEHSLFETFVRTFVEALGISAIQGVILRAAESGQNGTQLMCAFCMYEYDFPYSQDLRRVLSRLLNSPSVNVRTAAVFALQKHIHHDGIAGVLRCRLAVEVDCEVLDHLTQALS